MKRLAHQSSPNKMTVTNVVPLDAEMGENQVRRVGGIIPLSLSLSLSFTRTLSRTDARTHASVAINGDPALSACAFRQQKHQKKKKKNALLHSSNRRDRHLPTTRPLTHAQTHLSTFLRTPNVARRGNRERPPLTRTSSSLSVLMGWTAFGGPAAHIGIFQKNFVEVSEVCLQ